MSYYPYLYYSRSYNGKIIRIDVDDQDPGKEYAIPPDNPFISDIDAFPEIYAYGFVQPWRCSVDPGDPVDGYGEGREFCGDVGVADFVEEVNLVEKGGNYGYPLFEGTVCIADNQTCDEGEVCILFKQSRLMLLSSPIPSVCHLHT